MSALHILATIFLGLMVLPLVLPFLLFALVLPFAFIVHLIPESRGSKWHPDNLKKRQGKQ